MVETFLKPDKAARVKSKTLGRHGSVAILEAQSLLDNEHGFLVGDIYIYMYIHMEIYIYIIFKNI